MLYKEIECKSACNKLHRKIPYEWDLNIYRGCEHACIYCFAIYTHKYIEDTDYFNHIHVKTNIVEELEKQLKKSSWKKEVINIGGVTDSYQPCEANYKLMPEILKLLIKYKNPCIISSKSDLILRDYDLIEKLAHITYVNIAQTITCVDNEIVNKIEPYSATWEKRFEVLKAFSQTKASVGLHCMPLIPFISDTTENIRGLLSMGKKSNVTYVLPGILYLKGKTRNLFFSEIKEKFPHLYEDLFLLYKNGKIAKEYKIALYSKIQKVRSEYKISFDYMKPMKVKLQQCNSVQQGSLFDL